IIKYVGTNVKTGISDQSYGALQDIARRRAPRHNSKGNIFMVVNYEEMMARRETRQVSYEQRDSMLYALGVGFARAPMNGSELLFVYENPPPKTVPTMACVLAGGAGIVVDSGINLLLMVHGEQRMTLYRPLPPRGVLNTESYVKALVDKGEG